MRVLNPIQFQNSHLISSTATETISAYSPGSTYSIGNRVRYDFRIYESLVDSNTGNQPDISPTKWLNISSDNTRSMFDYSVSTTTNATSSLVVVLQPNFIVSDIAIVNCNSTTINITVKDSPTGPVIYNKTENLIDNSIVIDWYLYFFEEFNQKESVIFNNIPPYSSCYITATFTGSTISVGSFLYGSSFYVGETQYGVGFGIRDYSVKETDDYGNTVFIERPFSKRLSPQVAMLNSNLRFVSKKLQDIRAKPTVWIPTDYDEYDSTIIYGYYKDFNIDIAYPSHSLISIDIEGLI